MLCLYVAEEYFINSLDETKNLAIRLSDYLEPGTPIFLFGPVGIGKSTLVKLLLEHFNITYRGSPTFGLMSVYETNLPYSIVHMDLYNKPNKVVQEIYELQDNVFLIEWPSIQLEKILPNPIRIELAMSGKNRIARLFLP